MHRSKRSLWIIPALLLAAIASFVVWGLTPLGPSSEALNALSSDSGVFIQTGRFTEFIPHGQTPRVGLILYPGGRVDWRSYAPLARAIAAQGFYVAIVPMPLSLAVLSPGSAAEVIASQPESTTWAVGGHSLGGAMAANFAYQNPGLVEGLVLWAAYPAESNNLSSSDLKVVSIFASQDGLATKDKIDASRNLLPADTRWIEVAGGNHAQFGSYGEQPGDGAALISPERQQSQVADATVKFLQELARR